MKIGWATPLYHASAIGRFSVGVAQALVRRGIEVDLLRTERAHLLAESRLPTELKIVNLAGIKDYGILREYDLLAYNIGDNIEYHHHAVDAAMRMPGICIFHDLLIINLFNGWMAARGQAHRTPAMIDEIYGPGTFSPRKASQCHMISAVEHYPMLEWLAPYGLAAIAHGRHYLARLSGCCAGPVRHIPLAYDLPEAIAPPRRRSKGDTLRLATIGHINENKLCSEVIKALGRSRHLARSCTYRAVGPITEKTRSHLGGLAKRLGVSVEITGALSRSDLAREIENADAILCLRRPVLEGASASAIEAMLSCRPTVILDHGFYQELPDDLTLKIPPDFALQDLERKISWLFDHPEESHQLGQRAAAWAREAFSFSRYADAFLQLAEKASEAEPLMRLGTQLGQELLALGAKSDDPAAIRIAQVATKLFCPGGILCPQI